MTDDLATELKAATARQQACGSLFQSRVQDFTALCTMGSFEEAESARKAAHARLDAMFDAIVESFRLTRRSVGL